MALDFPSSPTNGQAYGNYIYSSVTGAWKIYNADNAVSQQKANLSGGNTFSGNQIFNSYVLKNGQPRFQAYGASGTSGTSSQDWVFPSTYVNVGSNYNTSTGRFTAPITGTYIFFWSNIGNTPNTVYRYLLLKNGTGIDDLHLRLGEGITGYRDSGDKKAMINLAAGDYVNIKFISDNGTASYTSGQYPWFGGYLLG